MPMFYQHTINDGTKIGVWNIAEAEEFFLKKVPVPVTITHWHKRLQHLAGRYLLQELFADFPYILIEIADTKKPFLPNEKYHFSISHCGDYAAVIISKRSRVGVDIELVRQKVEKIKYKFLSEQELLLCTNANNNLLTLFWSAKEAVFKWYGGRGINFKNHIILKKVDLNNQIISVEFLKKEKIYLTVHYKFFDAMCLAWVIQ